MLQGRQAVTKRVRGGGGFRKRGSIEINDSNVVEYASERFAADHCPFGMGTDIGMGTRDEHTAPLPAKSDSQRRDESTSRSLSPE